MFQWLTCIFLLASATVALVGDEVVTVDARGKTRVRKGTVSDYKNRELILLSSNREVKIPAKSIVRIETDWSPSHVQADELYEQHQYEQALEQYRLAFRADQRRWVKRQVLARVVRCQTNTGRIDEACKNFALLTADDAHTVHFDAIPLAWQNRQSPEAVVRQVLPWLSEDNRASNQLMAASWLLNSPQRDAANRVLRALGRNEWEPVAKLAVSQMWRAELVSLKKARLDWWEQHVDELPTDLRAGSYYLLGLSWAKHGNADRAALAFLRLPTQYPHQTSLSNASLFRCGEVLQQSGQVEEAKRCYQRLIEANAPESSRAKVQLNHLAK